MATIKLCFRPSVSGGEWGSLYYQVTHQRRVRTLSTDHHLIAENWDDSRHTFIPSGNERQQAEVRLVASMVRWEMQRMAEIVSFKESTRLEYTADELLHAFQSITPVQTLFAFMRSQSEVRRQRGRVGTAASYSNVLRSFMLFRGGRDLTFDMLTHEIIDQYEGWLQTRGVCVNSSSCYMRVLRAVYRMSVRAGLTPDRDIFRNVYMGYARTAKRALSARDISRLASLPLPPGSSMAFARDLFLFSIYMRGMSFADMAFLRRDSLMGGVVTYSRMKTRQTLSIAWESCMQEIVDRYASLTQDTPYLLPIITRMDGTERKQYQSALRACNRALKRVGEMLHLRAPLTTYVARHTWASMAQEMHVPLSVIREGMGHEDLRTTQIYLASINSQVVDRANRRIINKEVV